MKIVLRCIAVCLGIVALLETLALLYIATGGWRRLPVGPLALGGMGLVVVLGGFAAVQLWRLRQSGRYATLALFGFWLTSLFVGAGLHGQSPTTWDFERMSVMVLLAVLLLLPNARRACN